MIVDEKVLLAMSRLGKSKRPENGLYVEGFEGGISLYAFKGNSLFRRNLFGDNTRKFTQNFPEWPAKRIDNTGYVHTETFTNSEEIFNTSIKPADMVKRFKALLDRIETPHQAFARVNACDLYKAVQAVTVIQKWEPRQSAVLSFHNGFLNVAAWSGIHGYAPGEEFAAWEEVSPAVQIEGSCHLEKTALIALRSKGEIIIELIRHNDAQTFRFRTEEMDSAVMPIIIDEENAEIFRTALGYDYQAPKSTGAKEEIEMKKAEEQKAEAQSARAAKPPKEKKPRKLRAKKAPEAQEIVSAPLAPIPVAVAPEPGAKVKKMYLYGDPSGRWLSVPKTVIAKYNLWDSIKESALETKTLICPVWGEDADPIIEALKGDGFHVEIDPSHIVNGKSTVRNLPHYQKAG
jgi:hypothetical protein